MLLATRRVAGGVGRRRGVLDGRRAVVARCFCATPPKKDASSSSASSSSASSSSASSSEASSPITSPSPEKSPPPPWRQIAILSGSSFIANAGFGCIIPVLPSLSESLSLGAVGVGVILSAPAFARVLLNVRLGRLADEIGRRRMAMEGCVGDSFPTISSIGREIWGDVGRCGEMSATPSQRSHRPGRTPSRDLGRYGETRIRVPHLGRTPP